MCVSVCVCVCGGVVCNFLDHVSVQQKFEAAGQCYSYVTGQFKQQASVTACLSSVLFGKQRKTHP